MIQQKVSYAKMSLYELLKLHPEGHRKHAKGPLTVVMGISVYRCLLF